ncbi:hypothetical protein V7114_14675 [Neobacillus niacini]|uniref:hypothetical protein n=1 Tax=Neobacillus niacini TaxID=86668 RepID=UPI002FFE0645
MKKIFIIVGLIVLVPFLPLGFYFVESVYYEAMDFKAEKAALEYLEEKYDEHFVIDEVGYAKVLGDEGGGYTLQAHPVGNGAISFTVGANEKYQVTRDDYKESKWENDFSKEMVQRVESLFPGSGKIYAYGSFPEEIVDRYSIDESYQFIIDENPLQSFERIHIVNFEEPFEKETELKKIYELWEMVKDRPVNNNNIEINYYPRDLFRKLNTSTSDLNQFENQNREEMFYFCRISKDAVQEKPISSPEDIEGFCRELR